MRAVSIFWVVWFHLEARDSLLDDGIVKSLVLRGVTGVTVFFVISGFLITTLLLREEQRAGTISLTGFYRRRAYRILPAAFAYLAVALAFTRVSRMPWNLGEWLGAALFFRNLVPPGANSHLTGHFWSLSIEEQFYLVWPLLVVLIAPRRRLWVTLGLCLFAPVWRHLMTKLAGGGPINIGRIDLNYDSLLVGALLAQLQQRPQFRNLFDRYRFASLILPAAVVAMGAQIYWGLPFGVLGVVASPTVQLALVAMIIKILTEGRCRPAQVICGLPPVVWLGRLSYSLYLWQTLFCEYRGNGPLWQTPWCLFASVAAAMASYYLIEQPILRLRERRPNA
jgi:peptidoglycan/LPS O-acetylase OafA/YrhL